MTSQETSSESSDFDVDFMRETNFVPAHIGETTDTAQPGADPNAPQLGGVGVIPTELVQQGLTGTFEILFGIIAEKRGQHWQLKPFEKEGLATAWAPLAQLLLSRLGSSEQGMLALALMTTTAVVGGKVAQDATKRALLTVNTKTHKSEDSPAFLENEAPARPLGQSS